MDVRRYNKLDAKAVTQLLMLPEIADWVQEEPALGYRAMLRVWERTLSAPHIFVLGRNPGKEIFMFTPLLRSTYNVHVALHPSNRNGDALQAALAAAGWIFDHINCLNLLAFIPDDHKACCAFVAMGGMKRIGKTEKTFSRNGIMIDEVIYQLSLDDYRRQ